MPTNRVLVIEDDQIMLEVVSRIMRSEGFEVIACNNGPKGVHEALASKPDLILLDLMMPSPDPAICPVFDGHTVLSWMQNMAELKDTPVIVITAKPASEHKRNTIMQGACAYLQKPIDRKRLISAVRIALDDGRQHQPQPTSSNGLAELEELYRPPTVDDTNWRMAEDLDIPEATRPVG